MCAFYPEKQPERTPKREAGKAGSESLTCKGLCSPSAHQQRGDSKGWKELRKRTVLTPSSRLLPRDAL